MKYFRKIICIIIVVIELIAVVNLTEWNDVNAAEYDYTYYQYDWNAEITTDIGTEVIKGDTGAFESTGNSSGYRGDGNHIKGNPIKFYPSINYKSDDDSVTMNNGRVMYFVCSSMNSGKLSYEYTYLCYNDGTPIIVDEKDNNKLAGGGSLKDVSIYLYKSEKNRASNIDEDEYINEQLQVRENWTPVSIMDITRCDKVSTDSSLDNASIDEIKNIGYAYRGSAKTNIKLKWSDFNGDSDGKCYIALIDWGETSARFVYVDSSQNGRFGQPICLLTKADKNDNLRTKPKYKSKISMNRSTTQKLPTKMFVAGAYAGLNGNNPAKKITNAYSFSSETNSTEVFYFEKSLTDQKVAAGDIGASKDTAEMLKKYLSITVPKEQFKKGYYYIALDYILGESINVQNETYDNASWNNGGTIHFVIIVKEKGDEEIAADFRNASTLSSNAYALKKKEKNDDGSYKDVDDDDAELLVCLKFSGGKSKIYKSEINIYDYANVVNNEDKIKNGEAKKSDIVSSTAKSLVHLSTNNLKLDNPSGGNKVASCDDKNFKTDVYGRVHIKLKDIGGVGTYYAAISVKPSEKDDNEYTRWVKFKITETKEEAEAEGAELIQGGSKEYTRQESIYEERTAIEANRELTFAEERKIDTLNKELDNKLEMERWGLVYTIMALCGIVILVYSILMIVVYYLDLFNSLTEVSLYHKLTFGHMYPVGSADNLEHLRINEDSKVIYATHKTAWGSFVIGVLASAILLNGRTVVVIFIRLINWFSSLIANIGG